MQVNSRFSAAAGAAGTEAPGLPQVYVAFQMDRLQLLASDCTLLFMDKLKLDAKVIRILV